MSNSNKALFGLIALTAFAVGWVVNSARVADTVDASALVQAQLPYADGVSSIEPLLSEITLVNFWASWCTPCRKEMPVFEAMYQRDRERGFGVIGIAIDQPERAQPMLDSMAITYPILYAEESGMTLMTSVGNPQGLLPYTLLLDRKGRVLEQVLGPIHAEDIDEWVKEHL